MLTYRGDTATHRLRRLATDIQAEATPLILGGGDVLMAAETGSGKTGAFCLPVLQIVHESRRNAIADTGAAAAGGGGGGGGGQATKKAKCKVTVLSLFFLLLFPSSSSSLSLFGCRSVLDCSSE